jgi:hypothetical protein
VRSKRIIVNTHIEKTAGTSLLRFFEQTVGKNRIAFYDPTTDSLIRISDLLISPSNDIVDQLQLKSYAFWPILKRLYFNAQSNKRYTTAIPSDLAVIHGHFVANRFDNILPNAIHTVVIRDPLQRMHSQYDHWKRAKGRNHWRVIVPYEDAMTFEEYAMLPVMQNYQANALAGKDLKSFAIVGITERLDAYTAALYEHFIKEGYISDSIPFKNIQKLNIHKKDHTVKKSGFETAFQAFHKEDYELYKEAKLLAK